jgi:hypothetical protein
MLVMMLDQSPSEFPPNLFQVIRRRMPLPLFPGSPLHGISACLFLWCLRMIQNASIECSSINHVAGPALNDGIHPFMHRVRNFENSTACRGGKLPFFSRY